MKLLAAVCLLLMTFVLVACPAGQTSSPSPDETEVAETERPEDTDEPEQTEAEGTQEPAGTDEPVTVGCPADLIQSDDADATEHVAEGETVEYDTNPPAAGPHAGTTADVGVIYGAEENGGWFSSATQESPYTVENFVHSMEHGAVVFWTNNLSEEEQLLAEDTVNELYGQGYQHLIMVEYNDMDVPFAMTAWSYLQECEAMDELTVQNMQLFTDSFYGSGIEGFLACSGEAAALPGCEKWAE